MTTHATLAITLAAYAVVLLAIGAAARGRARTDGDFYLGGRRLGPWVAAIAASATSSSAWTLLGVSGAAYAWGLSALWLFPACLSGFLLNWLVLAGPLARQSRARGWTTVADVLADGLGRSGGWAVRRIAATVILLSLGCYVAAQLQGAGKVFDELFDVPAWQSVLVGAAVVLGYTLLGGFTAVSVTDTLQGLLMALTAAVLPMLALSEVGGLPTLASGVEGVEQVGYASVWGPREGILTVGFVLGLLGIGLGYPGQPHVVKVFMALTDRAGALRRARIVAILWAVVVYGGMLVLGLCGRVLFPELEDREQVLLRAATELTHPVVAGVMLAAVLSAMMSTTDSQLLVASSTVTHDLRPGRPEGGSSRRARWAIGALTALAAVFALVGSSEIFSRVLFAWSAMGAAFGPLLLLRVVGGRRFSARRTSMVMLMGALTSVLAHAFDEDLLGSTRYRGFVRQVVPYVFAFATALWPRPKRPTPARSPSAT